MNQFANCKICPHQCGVNRLAGEIGRCGAGSSLKIASAFLHGWEEPFLSGERGSGTIFLTHCSLSCVFCQNFEISQQDKGRECSLEEFAQLCLDLQQQGAHNINLVSPTHYAPLLAQGLKLAKENGLNLPVVYNTNGYERVEILCQLDGLVDIYLPDLKYFANELALRYSGAPGYFAVAAQAVQEMHRQVGNPVFTAAGLLKKGLVIRHLVLPGLIQDSKRILAWLAANLPREVFVSLMGQYTPVYQAAKYPELNRKLTEAEYEEVIEAFLDLGLENGLRQELTAASPEFIPDF